MTSAIYNVRHYTYSRGTNESNETPYERKCKYAFKRCPNPRSSKRNGQLHSYCEFHRRRANSTQKHYAQKKKFAMDMMESKVENEQCLWQTKLDNECRVEPLPLYLPTGEPKQDNMLSWDELEYVLDVLSY
ncbi:hypothetical protein THRCLA_07479 [Thraustotheca clavata]|uniref:Uncharacterized protein n=1 Tax=Thraustotheca clavata TaxID=74557 RepID=A0A1V9ZDB9_9STRA|nr:hypothetical protein THRCLA_07479 [Thraustotheca clavata]